MLSFQNFDFQKMKTQNSEYPNDTQNIPCQIWFSPGESAENSRARSLSSTTGRDVHADHSRIKNDLQGSQECAPDPRNVF